MARLITPLGILTTVALLAIYGAYCIWIAYAEHSWISAVAGMVTLVAAIATARLLAWARFLVYLLTAVFVATWGYSVYSAAAAGYFSLYSTQQIALSLGPGILLVLLSSLCSYFVFAHYRSR